MSKWDDFEEENNAAETSRLRGDSDVTREPALPESRSPVPGWRSYIPTQSFELLEVSGGNQDAELRGILRTLRTAAIIVFGVGLGLIIGAGLFPFGAQNGNSASHGTAGEPLSQKTESPTEPKVLPTYSPSKPPSYDPASSIISLDDPRFGALPYRIDERIREQWSKQEKLKGQVRQSLLQYYVNSTQNNKFREMVCDVFPNPPVKYEFPAREYKSKLNLEQKLRHVRQYKFALYEYYHADQSDASKLFYTSNNKETMLTRLATMFIDKWERQQFSLKIGTMGTSVMSGHDNCRYYTYPYVLERSLKHLLAPWSGADVEVRNLGQNGDGPSHENQLLCSPFTLGNVDAVHMWYAMMNPQAEPIMKHWFEYKMIRDNSVKHFHFVDAPDSAAVSPPIDEAGFISASTSLRKNIDWAPKHFWGRRDDGLCHNVTRDGAIGVSMQNWHLGPIGFQVLVDEVMILYADAMERALVSLIQKSPLPTVPQVKDLKMKYNLPNCGKITDRQSGYTNIHKYLCHPGGIERFQHFCWNGVFPQWSTGSNLYKNAVEPAMGKAPTVFPTIGESNVGQFTWTQVKRPSGWSNAAEKTEGGYESRGECADFIDIGYALRSTPAAATGWLTFSFTKAAHNALRGAKKMHILVCTGQRDSSGFSNLVNYSIVFAVDGRIWGETFVGPAGPCLQLNYPNALEVPQPDTIMGFRFIGSTPSSKVGFTIGEIILLRVEEDETPVPSKAATLPTPAPVRLTSPPKEEASPKTFSPTPTESTDVPHSSPDEGETTDVPHPSPGDEDDEGPTEVPHPSREDDDEPTVVPHSGDDGDQRRRQRRIRQRLQ